jgi:hypothetical protein
MASRRAIIAARSIVERVARLLSNEVHWGDTLGD